MKPHFHVFVWHRHSLWHRPRGRHTFGWHAHVLFRHTHGPEGAKPHRRPYCDACGGPHRENHTLGRLRWAARTARHAQPRTLAAASASCGMTSSFMPSSTEDGTVPGLRPRYGQLPRH